MGNVQLSRKRGELERAGYFDYVIINENSEKATEELCRLIKHLCKPDYSSQYGEPVTVSPVLYEIGVSFGEGEYIFELREGESADITVHKKLGKEYEKNFL